MSERVFAGIVTFNPDLDRLHENLASIGPQVDRVLIFDNGSNDVDSIESLVADVLGTRLHREPTNLGIASALNWLVAAASSAGAKWLVTLDQDSIAGQNMVELLLQATDRRTPLVTPHIIDRNKSNVDEFRAISLPPVQYYRRAAQKGAITSGCLLDVEVARAVGGFDEQFFIDYVDYDFNQRVLLSGYRIARVNTAYLLHEVGQARTTWLWTPRRGIDGGWRLERFFSFGHGSSRCYYKARNRIYFTRKYARHIGLTNEGALQVPQQILLTLMFEDDRLRKLQAFARGVWDGLTTPLTGPTYSEVRFR